MGNNASNAPTTGVWYYGEVIAHNTNYVRQIAYRFASDNSVAGANSDRFERIKHNGTWGAWVNTSVKKAVPVDAKFTDTTYNTGNSSTAGLTKLYTQGGSNTDGTMTQSAITSALGNKAEYYADCLTGSTTHTIAVGSSGVTIINAGGAATWMVVNGTLFPVYNGNSGNFSATYSSSNKTVTVTVPSATVPVIYVNFN